MASSYCWRRCVRATGEGDAEKGHAYQHAGSGDFFYDSASGHGTYCVVLAIGLLALVNIRCNAMSNGKFVLTVGLSTRHISYCSDV